MTALHERLADPRLYQENADEVQTLKAELERCESELETCFGRWEALEAKT